MIISTNVAPTIPYDMSIRVHRVSWNNHTLGTLVVSPTGNCQLNCWRFFNNILSLKPKFSEFKEYYDKFKDNRNLLLVDIKYNLVPELEDYVGKDRVVTVSPYDSTNGSRMCIIIINMG